MTTRSEAKSKGLKTYFTGKPCPQGHMAERSVRSGTCCECKRLVSAAWNSRNKTQQQEYGRAYRAARGEDLLAKKREYQRSWNQENAEQKRLRDAEYSSIKRRQRDARFMANAAHRAAKYCRALTRSTPKWVDVDAMSGMYELAALFRRIGLRMEVDHVVPLQGKTVSGLHTADNLQLLLRHTNASKSNRSWPDMP
jgi:hypothetical protein